MRIATGSDDDETDSVASTLTLVSSATLVTPIATTRSAAPTLLTTAWKRQNLRISNFDGASRPVFRLAQPLLERRGGGRVAAQHQVMASALTGKVATWFGRTRLRIGEDEVVVEVLAEHLRAKYGRRESAPQTFNAVMQLKRLQEETFEEFAKALEDLGLGSTLEEEQYVEAFINGESPLVRASLVARVPETLIEACERAHRMAGSDGAVSEKVGRPAMLVEYAKGGARVLAATPGLTKYGPAAGASAGDGGVHGRRQQDARKRQRHTHCFVCDGEGHFARECPLRASAKRLKAEAGLHLEAGYRQQESESHARFTAVAAWEHPPLVGDEECDTAGKDQDDATAGWAAGVGVGTGEGDVVGAWLGAPSTGSSRRATVAADAGRQAAPPALAECRQDERLVRDQEPTASSRRQRPRAHDELVGKAEVRATCGEEARDGADEGGELSLGLARSEATAEEFLWSLGEESAAVVDARGAAVLRRGEDQDEPPAAAIKSETPILTLATDGLPTATVELGGVEHELTIDTGARYSIVGRQKKAPLAVEGVYRFRCKTIYGQAIMIDMLAIDGCMDEFILGLDFLRKTRAIINHATLRADVRRWRRGNGAGRVPGRIHGTEPPQRGEAGEAAARWVRAEDQCEAARCCEGRGSRDLYTGAHSVQAAASRANGRHGARWLCHRPDPHFQGGRVKLPPRHLLGTWEPLYATLTAIEVSGGLRRGAVDAWIDAAGGQGSEPLPGEAELSTWELVGGDRELMLRLLRCYPRFLKRHDGCQPPVTTSVRHATKTGAAAEGIERHVVEVAVVLERLDQAGMALKPSKCTFGASSIIWTPPRTGWGAAAAEAGVCGQEVSRIDGPGVGEAVRPPRGLRPQVRSALRDASRVDDALAKERHGVAVGLRGAAIFRDAEARACHTVGAPVSGLLAAVRAGHGRLQVGVGAALMQDSGSKLLPVAYASSVNNALTKDAMVAAQGRSKQCQELAAIGTHKGVLLRIVDGVLKARTDEGWRTVLPTELWAAAFREAHGSI
ncbi:hypothetical protein PybrP1_008056 [[Pythium] brassicae (nom. inval.)]|nr:hypothetical protein PybrP1_008056 [[Pythium] brassicae (nom. inval.)]